MNPLPALISSLPDSGCSLQSTGDLCGSTMKPRPKAVYHLGTCTQCAGEGDVITIEADPIPLSLCPACLALILARSSGTRRAIREQWEAMHRRRSGRLAELQRKAREDLQRVADDVQYQRWGVCHSAGLDSLSSSTMVERLLACTRDWRFFASLTML